MSATQAVPTTGYAARVYDAYKVYGEGETEVRALDGVTVGFRTGSFTAVMGPSGSGKSTLVQCAAGLDHLTWGRAFIGDTEITTMDATELTELRRTRIGFVFQSFNLLPSIDAEANIRLPAKLAGVALDEDHLREVIDTLGIADRLGHRPAELSGGQRQRVAVARALSMRPELLIGDEPTGNLDARSSGEVLDHLRRAVDTWGQTVVIVTHDPVAAGRADDVVFLADGRIVDALQRPGTAAIVDRLKSLTR